MSKATERRLDKIEKALGMTVVDEGDDLHFETRTAAQVEAAHRALVELLLTWPSSEWRDAEIARLEAAHVPGPRRVRRPSAPAEMALDLLLATRTDNARAITVASARGFDPTARRVPAR